MSKINDAIMMLDWKIVDANKELEDYRSKIRTAVESHNLMREADAIKCYADSMVKTAEKLKQLGERKRELEWLAAEEVKDNEMA